MKVRVKFVLLAVLLGISSLLEAQNLPDFFKGLTPWANDSIPVYKGYRVVGEWGEELYSYYYDDDYRIERNEKENWVSSYRSYSSFYDTDNDNEPDSLVVKEETSTKYFNENQSIDSVIVVTISKDSLGSVVGYRKDREFYNEAGELLNRINFLNKNGVITCDTFFIDDTNSLCPEGSVVTESGDTTICSFSSSYADILEKYNKTYKEELPKITPHVCRHTYCSNMAKTGINPKTLQYLMGHSEISVTLDVYTHVD